ncbi:hypothetical protein AB0N05_16685 [Nocardia sp. NPDC051030]|uniref:esterase/lipase family protein n=1 Tax=Nocardia sp. NPDC051030 TaxID=3155162 RepID=UPI003438112D
MRNIRVHACTLLSALTLPLCAATTAHAGTGIAPPISTTIEPALDCTPSPDRPNPVVLLAGFGAVGDITATINKQMAGIMTGIRTGGGCALPFAYGIIGPMHAAAGVPESAQQLSDFIEKVLATTEATHVDIVAHSSGALVANYYLKFLHGSPQVEHAVFLAPVTRGTTAATLTAGINLTATPDGPGGLLYSTLDPLRDTLLTNFQGALDCLSGSEITQQILEGGITQPGVTYAVLSTRGDQILTPVGTASFIEEPGVENAFLEDLSPEAGTSTHAALPMTPAATQWTLNHLYS